MRRCTDLCARTSGCAAIPLAWVRADHKLCPVRIRDLGPWSSEEKPMAVAFPMEFGAAAAHHTSLGPLHLAGARSITPTVQRAVDGDGAILMRPLRSAIAKRGSSHARLPLGLLFARLSTWIGVLGVNRPTAPRRRAVRGVRWPEDETPALLRCTVPRSNGHVLYLELPGDTSRRLVHYSIMGGTQRCTPSRNRRVCPTSTGQA